jgi:hypothetical protein
MFTDAKTVTTKAVAFKHGVGAGKIVQCYAPACQFGRPKYENAQGRLAWSVDMRLCPVAGNDELLIIVNRRRGLLKIGQSESFWYRLRSDLDENGNEVPYEFKARFRRLSREQMVEVQDKKDLDLMRENLPRLERSR